MNIRFKSVITVLGCAGIACSLSVSSALAGPFRDVVDECKNRSHMSDAFCMSIVRNNLTVENCMERSDLSEAECGVKIQAIKDDPEFAGDSKSKATNPSVKKPTYTPSNFSNGESAQRGQGPGVIADLRIKKERDLVALWEKTQALLSLLKKHGEDVQAIEGALPEFERRSEILLRSYDTYRSVYEGTVNDTVSTRRAVRSKAKEPVERAIQDLVEYYQSMILAPLRDMSERIL